MLRTVPVGPSDACPYSAPKSRKGRTITFARVVIAVILAILSCSLAAAGEMEGIRVSENGTGFVYATSGRPFVPWGLNYDHDAQGRLLEDYWETEWPKVEEDFQAMKRLGANVVRIHLQVGRFLDSAEIPSAASLARLGSLLALAEETHLYLDLTGLGCYHKQDVPAWYDRLSEDGRWKAQARFWEAVADRCAKSPAVFCYDLMNEPVVPGGARKAGDWLAPPFGGECFVQFITLEPKDRPRGAIARQWCHQLAAAIRKHDRRHLVTVGLVPWSLDRPGLTSGFVPKEIAPELDFLCVHIYPAAGKVGEALDTLKGFSLGKPVVVEEMFPLACSIEELGSFVDQSAKVGAGMDRLLLGQDRRAISEVGNGPGCDRGRLDRVVPAARGPASRSVPRFCPRRRHLLGPGTGRRGPPLFRSGAT